MTRATTILVVDDDETMRMVLDTRLRKWGYEVLTASDGAEGERQAKSGEPDIVISDVVMPELSGMDLLRALKQGDSGRPVIMMTAHSTVDMAVEAMKQGAQDFITKPLDYSKLQAILEAATRDIALREESQKLELHLEKTSGFGS